MIDLNPKSFLDRRPRKYDSVQSVRRDGGWDNRGNLIVPNNQCRQAVRNFSFLAVQCVGTGNMDKFALFPQVAACDQCSVVAWMECVLQAFIILCVCVSYSAVSDGECHQK